MLFVGRFVKQSTAFPNSLLQYTDAQLNLIVMIEHYQAKLLMSLGSICISFRLLMHCKKVANRTIYAFSCDPRNIKVLLQQQKYLLVPDTELTKVVLNCYIMPARGVFF